MSDRGNIANTGVYGGLPDREKKYVDVVSLTTADALVTPLYIVWDDGRRFAIDKVTNRRQAHSLKTGGTGMRYTILVGGKQTYLYYDDYRKKWFVEAKRMRRPDP
ncbi:MAG: hypothetical protein Q4A01_09900 [Coriobacteriales bacterium]|nr:hypothetical protein [Coriobacteriales bacterium]